ncbi:hypothetical protein Peur_050486 [Populus x canadensis]
MFLLLWSFSKRCLDNSSWISTLPDLTNSAAPVLGSSNAAAVAEGRVKGVGVEFGVGGAGCCCQLTSTHAATLSSVDVALLLEGHQRREAVCWCYDATVVGLGSCYWTEKRGWNLYHRGCCGRRYHRGCYGGCDDLRAISGFVSGWKD